MRRALSCIAALAVALMAIPAIASAAAGSHVQGQGCADLRLPAHRQLQGQGRRRPGRIHDLRDRIPRLPAAGHRRQRVPAEGHQAPHERLPHLLEGDARTVRADQVPQGLGRRTDRQRPRLRDLRRRTRRRESRTVFVLLPRWRTGILHRRPLAGVAGNPVNRPLRQHRRSGRLRPGAQDQGAARRERARCSICVGQDDHRQGRLGDQVTRQNRLLRHRVEGQVPQRRLPDQDRSDLRRKRRRIETRHGFADDQDPLPRT